MKLLIEVKYVGKKFRSRVYEWRLPDHAWYIEEKSGVEQKFDWYVVSTGTWESQKAEWRKRTPEKAYKVAEEYVKVLEEREKLQKVRDAFEKDTKYEEER